MTEPIKLVSDERRAVIRARCETVLRNGVASQLMWFVDAREILDLLADLANAEARNNEGYCVYCGFVGPARSEEMIAHVKECGARTAYMEAFLAKLNAAAEPRGNG